jgi:hypothetical protein
VRIYFHRHDVTRLAFIDYDVDCFFGTINATDEVYTDGCLRFIATTANQQDMGIAIINCFMIILAFFAIPLLLGIHSSDDDKEEDTSTELWSSRIKPNKSGILFTGQMIVSRH